MAIYVNFEKPETLKEFLEKFFSYERSGHSRTSVETFEDEKCTIRQCDCNRYRSIDDLLECVNTYYPEVTIQELLNNLITLDLKSSYGTKLYFYPMYCDNIRKPVMLYFHMKQESLDSSSGVSKYNWISLLESMGIHDKNELYNYKKEEVLV